MREDYSWPADIQAPFLCLGLPFAIGRNRHCCNINKIQEGRPHPATLASTLPPTPLPSTYGSVSGILPVFLGAGLYSSCSNTPSAQERPACGSWPCWKYKWNNSAFSVSPPPAGLDLFLHSAHFLFLWAGSCANEGHELQGQAPSQLILELDLKLFNLINSIIHDWILIVGWFKPFFLTFHPDSGF